MYKQVLIVGLGGSGGKTLRFLRRDLLRWLEQYGREEIPAGWQFLQIDSPTIPDGAEVGVPMMPDAEYLGLVGPAVQFSDVAKQLDQHPSLSTELSTWRVAPAGLDVSITIGAGQYRAIGRTLSLAYTRQIRSEIDAAIKRLKQSNARADLDRLYQEVNGKPPTSKASDPLVIVVSSLAGGSGAGLVNDVCDVIREKESWGKPIGILYTPEVFKKILGSGKNGVQPNSLAAISEVLNGYWWHGGQQDGDAAGKSLVPMKLAPGGTEAINRTGPEYPFLVGAANSAGVTYSSDNQLFETVGAALLGWLNDESVQRSLESYGTGNWKQMAEENQPGADVLVNRGSVATNEAGIPSFSALGFGRVSVGAKYFGTYSSQLIARDSINHILTYHTQSEEAQQVISRMPNNRVDVDAVVSELASNQVLNFMHRAGLDEKGSTNNQILDELRPDNWEQAIGTVYDAALSSLMSVKDNLNSSGWQARVEGEVQNASDYFAQMMIPAIQGNVARWIESIPENLIHVTEEFVAMRGLRVTQSILQQVGAELAHSSDSVLNDLAKEEQGYYEESLDSRWKQTVNSYLTFGGKVPGTHQSIAIALQSGIYQAIAGTWAIVLRYAQDLIVEFEKDVIAPLSRTLGDAYAELTEKYDELCLEWPAWSVASQTHHGVVSPDATPAKSEWTLIKPSDFGQLFDDLLAKMKQGLGQLDQRNEVRTSVVSGSFIREMFVQTPALADRMKDDLAIRISQKWSPRAHPDQMKIPSSASFSQTFKVESIVKRANAWLYTTNSPFEDVLNSSLISYTIPNPVTERNNWVTPGEFAERQRDFIAAFSQAMDSSDPLVGIDTSVMAALYDGGVGSGAIKVHRTFSKIPFKGHPLESQVKTKLLSILGDEQKISDLLDGNGKTEHIDVVSWFVGPYPVFMFESLLKPIAESWSQLVRQTERNSFWTRRRARGLAEFIPAPQEHIVCMLRGWFTARLLGLVDVSTEPFSILQPRGINPAPAKFPTHLLSSYDQWGDIPAVMLESLGLAYVEVSRRNDLKSLDAYIALRDIGREGNGSGTQLLRYSEVSSLISDWIYSGKVKLESGAALFESVLPMSGSETGPAERKSQLLEVLEIKLLGEYTRLKVKYDQDTAVDPEKRTLTPLWPSLWDQIRAALEQLIDAVNGMDTGSTSKPGW
jgi:hypothetical protein